MNNTARGAAGLSVVLAPILVAVGDHFRMQAMAANEAGVVTDWGAEQAMADLVAIDANRGSFEIASWLFYAAAVVTVPAVVLLWRLAVDGSRRWAWAGATLGVCSVVGQFVHLMGYFGANQVFSAQESLTVPAQLMVDWESNAFSMALFAPYLVGFLFAPLVQSIALKRAGALPLWGLLAVIGGTVLFAALGSTPVVTTVWALLVVTGLAPVVVSAIRGSDTGQATRNRTITPAPAS